MMILHVMILPGLPLAGKFPCKRKFWPVQGKGQGNQIYQEMARKFEPGQGNCEEIFKIVYIRNKIELKVCNICNNYYL